MTALVSDLARDPWSFPPVADRAHAIDARPRDASARESLAMLVRRTRACSLAAAGRAGEQDRDGGFPADDVADLATHGLLAADLWRDGMAR